MCSFIVSHGLSNLENKTFFRRIEGFFSFFKQQYILHHLIAKSGGKEIISKYKNQTCDSCENIDATSPIWVCWWQGKENMPDIVKACYNSIQKHACNHPVILITEENFRNYIDMPEYIINKQKEGYIDITHFSDILRMMLLTKHGGIWMDSTLLIPSKQVDEFIHPGDKFWSCHHKPIYHNVSRGGWVSFFVACGKNNPLPSMIADLHLSYWKIHNKLINYLLLDYTFAIARKYIPAIHQMIELVPITVMGPLGKCLNDEYSEEEWNNFCKNYDFHKLTYKIPLQKVTPEGKKTFYGHILEEFLDIPSL